MNNLATRLMVIHFLKIFCKLISYTLSISYKSSDLDHKLDIQFYYKFRME